MEGRKGGGEGGIGEEEESERGILIFLEPLSIYLRRGRFVTFIKNVSIQCLLKKKKSIWDFLLYFVKSS